MTPGCADVAFGHDGVVYFTDSKVLYCVDFDRGTMFHVGGLISIQGVNGLSGAPPDARGERLLALWDRLYRLNLGLSVYPEGLGDLDGCGPSVGDLDYRRSDGVVFGYTARCGLIKIDPDTGEVIEKIGHITTTVPTPAPPFGAIMGMALDGRERLYASGGTLLLLVDPLTGRSLKDVQMAFTGGPPDFGATCGMAASTEADLTCDAGGPYRSGCRSAMLDGALVRGQPDYSVDYQWKDAHPDVKVIPDAGLIPLGAPERPVPPSVAELDAAVLPCGESADLTLTLWAAGRQGGCETTVTFDDDIPPVLTVPPPLTVECTAPGGTPATHPAIQNWLAQASAEDACTTSTLDDDAPAFFPGGCPPGVITTVTWTAADECDNLSLASSTVTVIDTTPPVVEPGTENLACLWPPNHWYVCLGTGDLGPVISDLCSEPAAWRFEACRSDQPDEAPDPAWPGWNGDGHTRDDCVIRMDGDLLCVRSERAGAGPTAQQGRHYEVSIVAWDECANTGEPVVIGNIHVPHDQSGHERPCLDPTKVGLKPKDPLP